MCIRDSDLELLNPLGVAFPLFFYLVKDLAVVLLLAFLVAGVPCLVGNLLNDSNADWYVQVSIGANEEVPIWQPILHCAAALIFLVNTIYFKRRTYNSISRIRNEEVTPSDFTIMIRGLSKDYEPDDLKSMFESMGKSVYSVSPVYDIRDYVKDVNNLIGLYKDLYTVQFAIETTSKRPKKGIICKSKD